MKKTNRKEMSHLSITQKRRDKLVSDTIQALGKKHTTVIKNTMYREDPGNSNVYASFWWLPIEKLLDESAKLLAKRFKTSYADARKNTLLGLNEVDINGVIEEETHYHISHIIGLITKGSGTVELKDSSGKMSYVSVKAGDTLIIPADAYHYLQGRPGIVYIAIEIGYKAIDYQKHHNKQVECPQI